MKSYETIFRKAKEIIEKNEIALTEVKESDDGQVFFFKVKDEYNVTLTLTKLNETKTSIWKREFTCDCRASIRANNELCSHTLACQTFLVLKL